MLFERITSEGLAHNSYLIGAGDEAAVIDPRRDCQVYADRVAELGLRLVHIFETHRNEDYVVGSLELGGLTGAEIYHGPGLNWPYGKTLSDGEELELGSLRIRAIHTPGHTDESMSYAVSDRRSGVAPVMVFSGDTLFVDEVGRTDLYGPEHAGRLASALYDSIFQRLLPLGDGVVLHPAHGAGSICGARIGARAESTLGIERTQSPVLRFHDKAGFVRYKLEEHQERPPYFRMMERYNLEGPPPVGGVRVPPALAPAEFRREMEAGATVVDMRQPSAFGGSHLKGSYSVWLDGLSTFAGWVLSYESPVLLVAGSGSEVEPACRQLSRLGYDRVVGYLKRGVEEWYSAGLPVEHLILMSVQELRHSLERGEELTVLDVRGLDEWQRGHIEGARNIYVGHLEERLGEVPRDKAVVVMCSSGWRGGLGASILLRAGYPNVMNVLGGFGAWKALGFPATGS